MTKRGDTTKQIQLAINELVRAGNPITTAGIRELTNINTNRISAYTTKMQQRGELRRLALGVFEKLSDSELPLLAHQPKSTQPLDDIIKLFDQLPELLTKLIDSIVELAIEPELEIANMLDRRNKRITDLEVLLSKDKMELSNSRAKLSDLLDKINRLQAQKNRVIPETKILVKNGV